MQIIMINFLLGGSEYIYNWGYFDNQGSYQSSTRNSHNLAIYGNIGFNLLKILRSLYLQEMMIINRLAPI